MAKFKPIYDTEIPEKARVTWSFLTLLPAVIMMIGSSILATAIFIGWGFATGQIDGPEAIEGYMKQVTSNTTPLLLVLPFVFFILISAFWTRVIEGRPLGTMGLGAHLWLPRYLGGFIMGMVFLLAVVGSIYLAGGYEIEEMTPAFRAPDPTFAILVIASFLVAFLVQGAGEEFIFRGWWMSALAARRGKMIALIVPAVLFGAAHLSNIWPPTTESLIGCANVVLFGIYIGLYALKERSLWGVCGWHSAWNWLLGLGFGLEVSGMELDATPLVVDLAEKEGVSTLLTGGAFGPEASLVTTAVLLLGSWWFIARGALRD